MVHTGYYAILCYSKTKKIMISHDFKSSGSPVREEAPRKSFMKQIYVMLLSSKNNLNYIFHYVLYRMFCI